MVHIDDMTHRRAVSPVIATVILIAVAVAIGIAVAFWASGLTTSFSKYEKLGISVGYADGTFATGTAYEVTISGDNSGSSGSTIVQVQVNGVPATAGGSRATAPPTSAPSVTTWYWDGTADNPALTTVSVPSGGSFTIWVVSPNKQAPWTPGNTVEITLVSAAGTTYPKAIVLP